jgi:hypothetical protein
LDIIYYKKKTIKSIKDAEAKEQVYKIYNRLERPLLESSMKRRVLVGDSFVGLLQCFSPNLF